MGYTKDLWTRSEIQVGGKKVRVPNNRWGKGMRWLACWLDPDGEERSKAFKNKTPADKYWAKMETDRDSGEYYDPKAGQVTLESIAQRWLASRDNDPATKIRYRRAYTRHIEPEYGKRLVGTIRPSEVLAFQAALRAHPYSVSTVTTVRAVLMGVLDLALADELIKKNPVRSDAVPPPSAAPRPKIEAWSDERVDAIVDAHRADLKLLPIIASTCGLRESELHGLAEEDIDYDEGIVHVRRQIKKLGSRYVFALPKSDKERAVPLPDWTAEWCQRHIKDYPPQPYTLPWEELDGPARTHRILFRWNGAGHVTAGNYSYSVWKPALVSLGLIPKPDATTKGTKRYAAARDLGLHQLRHYYASVMLADRAHGVSIVELAEFLGHVDPAFTLRIYGHMVPGAHDRARKAIDARRFRPRAV